VRQCAVVSRLAGAVGLVVAGLVAFGPAAQASVSAQPQHTVSFDAHVQVVVASGSTVYVGGQFTHATDLAGNVVARNHLAAINAVTGGLLAWNPRANKAVYALAVDAVRNTVYVGGDFSTIGGVTRNRLAAVDATTGTLRSWNHKADYRVRTLDVSTSRLYAGGQFTAIDGVARDRLAAFSLADGSLDAAWTPSASDYVYGLKVSLAGDRVYVGGRFASLNGGTLHGYAAALDPATGAIDPSFQGKVRYKIESFAVASDGVYAAGDGAGGHLIGWNLDGSLKFPTVQTDGGVQATAVLNGEVYAGGHFDNVCLTGNGTSGTGGGFTCIGAQATRHKLLSVDATTGTITGWNPGANSPLGVFTLAANPASGTLDAGGDFTLVAGQSQPYFAQFGVG
jgi:hypothetical protein